VIIAYRNAESSFLYDKDFLGLPSLITSGCGCCSEQLPCTADNIASAIREEENFLEELQSLEPTPAELYDTD
jgi:type III secretion system FlhB-like substrate exporter